MTPSIRCSAVALAAAVVAALPVGAEAESPEVSRRPALTLFVLGDSYTHASATHLEHAAREAGCAVAIATRFAKPGWTARRFIEIEAQWAPALANAAPPVVVYLTIGLNDIFSQEASQLTPEAAALSTRKLVDRLLIAVKPGGGSIVQVGYEDIWQLPDHPVTFMGITYDLPPEPSRLLPAFYAALPTNLPGYTFIDVRGWLGASLWTTDGVHMVDENFEEQARLLWERVFGPRLECDPVAGQN